MAIESDVTVAAGESVYVKSNAHVALSKADANATKRCRGLAVAGVSPSFAATVRTHGTLELADWTASTGGATLTPNLPYYVSTATAGAITSTAPTSSGYVTRIGTALSTTKMDVNPEPPIKL